MSEKVSVKNMVTQLALPIVSARGLELIDVEFAKKPDGMNLSIFVDKPGGVTVDDCEGVHVILDEALDKLDPTNGAPYVLNVCSPGVDRPLSTDTQLSACVGKPVEIRLFAAIDKKKNFVGELVDFDGKFVHIIIDNKKLTFERNKISKINKHITF